jgi:hypothetical protein
MGWPLPTTIGLPDPLSVNTLHTVPIIAPWPSCEEKTAPRPLIRESEDGSLLHCKLLAADNQKTADSPSSWWEVLPHSSWSCWPTEPNPGQTDRPTEQGNNHAGKRCVCCSLFVHTRRYLEWQVALLCRCRSKPWEHAHTTMSTRLAMLPSHSNVRKRLLQSANGLTMCGD